MRFSGGMHASWLLTRTTHNFTPTPFHFMPFYTCQLHRGALLSLRVCVYFCVCVTEISVFFFFFSHGKCVSITSCVRLWIPVIPMSGYNKKHDGLWGFWITCLWTGLQRKRSDVWRCNPFSALEQMQMRRSNRLITDVQCTADPADWISYWRHLM